MALGAWLLVACVLDWASAVHCNTEQCIDRSLRKEPDCIHHFRLFIMDFPTLINAVSTPEEIRHTRHNLRGFAPHFILIRDVPANASLGEIGRVEVTLDAIGFRHRKLHFNVGKYYGNWVLSPDRIYLDPGLIVVDDGKDGVLEGMETDAHHRPCCRSALDQQNTLLSLFAQEK